MQWFIYCLKNYAKFDGRAGRPEYWFYDLFSTLIFFILQFLSIMLGLQYSMNDLITVYPLASVWQVVTFIPSMAVGVRRMHDINRSGFWLLFLLLPLIGWLLIMIFAVLKGNDDDNDYGSPNLSPI
mgnify:FL=1